jgi:flavin reductase (DIM6/NTAB) family NADH-FMN oxidoreductase RutF
MTEASETLNSRAFRNALGTFPTGVAVVTTCTAHGRPVGLTVNSFSSLSLDPPLILWSLKVNSPSLATFDHSPYFAVNILAEDQVKMSKRFAASRPRKFAKLELRAGVGGVPLLAGCAAHLECRRVGRHNGGDHVLYIGHVEQVAYDRTKRPLVFYSGKYLSAGNAIP